MNTYSDVFGLAAGMIAGTVLLTASQGLAQSSSGVSGHSPPPISKRKPPSGPGLSRLPLVDPKVVPPGVSDPSQKTPPGEPGAASAGSGHTGETKGR